MLCVCGHTPSTAYFSSNPSASKADSASRHSRQASNNLNTPQNYDFSCCGSRRISTVTSKPVFAALRVSCESQCLLHAQRSARTLSRRCQIHHNRLLCTSIAKSSRIAEQQIVFRSATSTEDLQQASVLRADAYYEEQPHARYVGSFKKQFVEQSVRMLREQTARLLNASMPECVCLVALLPEAQQVLATCDVRPPENVAGQHPAGVPLAEQHAAYVTNVAVDSKTRGQGLGYQLLEAAAALAYEKWQAQALYTTVDSTNKAGANLYAKCGFDEHTSKQSLEGGTGRLTLLRATLPLKCNI